MEQPSKPIEPVYVETQKPTIANIITPVQNEPQKPIETPVQSVETPAQKPIETPQTITKLSELHLIKFNENHGSNPNTPHYISGFRKGVVFAVQEVKKILENPELKSRMALKEALDNI
jgi:hypothetical protein